MSLYSLVDNTIGRLGIDSVHKLLAITALGTAAVVSTKKTPTVVTTTAIGTFVALEAALVGWTLFYPTLQRNILVPTMFKKISKEKIDGIDVHLYTPRSISIAITKFFNQQYGAANLGKHRDGDIMVVINPSQRWVTNYLPEISKHEQVHLEQGVIVPFDFFYIFSPSYRSKVETEAEMIASYPNDMNSISVIEKVARELSPTTYGNAYKYASNTAKWLYDKYRNPKASPYDSRKLRW